MSIHETVCDAWASKNILSETLTGKIRKARKYIRWRDKRKPVLKAHNSAFLRELIPLLTQRPSSVM